MKKIYIGVVYSFLSVFLFQSVSSQQVLQDIVTKNAGTFLLGATMVYAGAWSIDFFKKFEGMMSLKPEYFVKQNPYFQEKRQEIYNKILIYGSSKNKLEEALSYANVPNPTIELSAEDVEHLDIPGLFKAVTLWSHAWEWVGMEKPNIPIIIQSIDNFSNRKYWKGNVGLSNLLKAIEDNPHVTVIGISDTDQLFKIDPALIRPGRLDHHICINSALMTIEEIESYLKKGIEVTIYDKSHYYSIDPAVSAIGIKNALEKMGFSATISIIDTVFKIASKNVAQRLSNNGIDDNDKNKKIIPEDIVNALINAQLRQALDKQGFHFKSILDKVLSLVGKAYKAAYIYNIRFFLSLMTQEKLIVLLTKLHQVKETSDRLSLLEKYIKENTGESVLRLVSMCQYLYNIQDSSIFTESLSKWTNTVVDLQVDNYLGENNSPFVDYFYKTIIPETLKICVQNSNSPDSWQCNKIKMEEEPGKNKFAFLSRVFNWGSMYSQLSLALVCSASVLWYRLYFS